MQAMTGTAAKQFGMTVAGGIAGALHPADRLWQAILAADAPVCVGIDPVVERLPKVISPQSQTADSIAKAMEDFCCGIIEAVARIVPCVKIQAACLERYGGHGFSALERICAAVKRANLQLILDAKRGDIGVTAEHYAAMAFEVMQADWLTVNGYLGRDSIEPFLRQGRGVFVLVRTSNPGSDEIQSRQVDEQTGIEADVSECVGRMVEHLGEGRIGASGYSQIGAVVGATKSADAARLRAAMPRSMFLIPGYGAQGGSVRDVIPCFHLGNGRVPGGGIVTASRSVIYAFESECTTWVAQIREAALGFRDEIRTGLRNAQGFAAS